MIGEAVVLLRSTAAISVSGSLGHSKFARNDCFPRSALTDTLLRLVGNLSALDVVPAILVPQTAFIGLTGQQALNLGFVSILIILLLSGLHNALRRSDGPPMAIV
jgi:hypothetical protein